MEYLPILPRYQYDGLLKKFHLTQLVRLLARVLTLVLPKRVLAQLHTHGFRTESRVMIHKDKASKGMLLEKELSSPLIKLGFYCLVKTSNHYFQPKRASVMGGVSYHKTRYSEDAMKRIFKSNLLVVISSKDKTLLKILFMASSVYLVLW